MTTMHWTMRAIGLMSRPMMLEGGAARPLGKLLARVAAGELPETGGVRLASTVRAMSKGRTGLTPAAMDDEWDEPDSKAKPNAIYGGREYWSLCAPRVDGDVLIVPIVGPIVRTVEDSIDSSGRAFASAYEDVQAAVMAGAMDARVRSMLLVVDSPGGEAGGAAATAQVIRNARALKPIGTLVEGDALSAGYYMASQCTPGRFMLGPDARVGNIGTLYEWFEYFRAMDAEGIDHVVVASEDIKRLRREPLTETQRAQLQADVDRLGALFHADVAAGRGVSIETAKGWSKEPWYTGRAAIDAGLADEFALNLTAGLGRLRAVTTAPTPNQTAAKSGQERKACMTVTRQQIEAMEGGKALIEKIESEARSASAEKAASIAELEAEFGSDASFILGQAKAGATMSAAKAAYAKVLATQVDKLKAENAELRAKVDAAARKTAATPAGHAAPLSLAKDGPALADDDGNAVSATGGGAKGTAENARALISQTYAKKADFAAACAAARKADPAGYRAIGSTNLAALQKELMG